MSILFPLVSWFIHRLLFFSVSHRGSNHHSDLVLYSTFQETQSGLHGIHHPFTLVVWRHVCPPWDGLTPSYGPSNHKATSPHSHSSQGRSCSLHTDILADRHAAGFEPATLQFLDAHIVCWASAGASTDGLELFPHTHWWSVVLRVQSGNPLERRLLGCFWRPASLRSFLAKHRNYCTVVCRSAFISMERVKSQNVFPLPQK